MKLAASLLFAAAAATALPAQAATPTAQQFLLDDYTTTTCLDMKAVRDSGVWDELAASALQLVGDMLQSQFGFTLDRIDRITSVNKARREGDEVIVDDVIVTIEGNAELEGLDELHPARYTATAVGAFTLLTDTWSANDAHVQVTPKLRVYGTPRLLTPVLEGKVRRGLPSPDVMTFTAGKKKLLLYAISDLRDSEGGRTFLAQVLPEAVWPQDDQPTFFAVHLLATGDDDDPHITLEVVLRHNTAGAGLAASEKAVAAALERLGKTTQARIVWQLLKQVAHSRDGSDAVYRVDLGRARHVGGMLTTLSPFALFAQEVQAVPAPMLVPVEIEVVAEPLPAPEKKKEQGGGK